LNQLPPPPWGVIADDLTGATDTAAAFARAGFSALVVLARRARLPSADVLVLSTDSRHDTPQAARRKAMAACRWLAQHQAVVLYKKMDSTLQGNIVPEVNAIRDAAGFATALVCPANPKQGRSIRRGQLTVRGESRGSIAEHFAQQGLQNYACLHLRLTEPLVERALAASRFVLADATLSRHLRVLAAAGIRRFPRVLLAGSAGLAAELAHALVPMSRTLRRGSGPARQSQQRTAPWPRPRRIRQQAPLPALLLCGSANPVTVGQLQALVQKGAARETQLGAQTLSAVRQMLLEGRSAIVHVPVHRRPDNELVRELRGLSQLLRERRVGSVLATGGDTALLVSRWLKPSAIDVTGEIVPGLASGRLVGGLAGGLRFYTKPGGFGTPTSLLPLVAALGCEPHS